MLLKALQSAVILACEQALLFGQAKRASRERACEGPGKLFCLGKRCVSRENARARGRRKESLQRSLIRGRPFNSWGGGGGGGGVILKKKFLQALVGRKKLHAAQM